MIYKKVTFVSMGKEVRSYTLKLARSYFPHKQFNRKCVASECEDTYPM